MQGEAQGLLAWALVKALFSTRMIIIQVSVQYYCLEVILTVEVFSCPYRYGITQIHMEEGKREKQRGEVIKGIPLFQNKTSPNSFTSPP